MTWVPDTCGTVRSSQANLNDALDFKPTESSYYKVWRGLCGVGCCWQEDGRGAGSAAVLQRGRRGGLPWAGGSGRAGMAGI